MPRVQNIAFVLQLQPRAISAVVMWDAPFDFSWSTLLRPGTLSLVYTVYSGSGAVLHTVVFC